MKKQLYFVLFLFGLIHCAEPTDAIKIIFLTKDLKVLGGKDGEDYTTSGKQAIIQKSGSFIASGESEEGNIIITSSSVTLYLQNLNLSSKKNSPIIVTKNLRDVKIINLENTVLNDLEDKKTTTGECATIKVSQNSTVYIENNDIFTLNGECKRVIKGGKQASITFGKAEGEYIINTKKTAIESDGLLQFDGGVYTIKSEKGDAIKSQPGDDDKESLGKILINDGTFSVHSFNDAFTAKNNIEIVNGKFNITTENGYDSKTYDENESAKGFKLTNNDTGCGILIHSGQFKVNAADDAFRSNRDITILSGKFTINSKDDAICAKYDLVLGKEDAPLEDLLINVENSYEALEGMTVTIYSGKIKCRATDDGINASGPEKEQWDRPGGRNRTRNESWPFPGNGSWPFPGNESWPFPGNGSFPTPGNGSSGFPNFPSWNNSSGRNNSGFDWSAMFRPNDSYIVSIHGGEINLFTDSDGIDSNGHIYLHGGKIYIFSEGQGPNEPIDHNGNFTLFNTEVLGVGTKGLEEVHKGLHYGNQKYAFRNGVITKDKTIEIFDEKKNLVKDGKITKDINYIFYTSKSLNEDYEFYITDDNTGEKTKLEMTFGEPKKGEDDQDILDKKRKKSLNDDN